MRKWKWRIKRSVHKWKVFSKLSMNKKWYAINIFILSGIIRAVILAVPFKKVKKHLGIYNVESTEEAGEEVNSIAEEIGDLVSRVCRITPWQSKCLVQAIVAKILLEHKKIDTTLYLGVAKEKTGNLTAHAWLRCGQTIVTGEGAMPQYKSVAKFATIYNKKIKDSLL